MPKKVVPPITNVPFKAYSGHIKPVSSIAYLNDATTFTTSWDSTIRRWDLQSGACSKIYEGHTDQVYCCAVHPQQKWLVSAGEDETITRWNINTAERVHVIPKAHTSAIYALSLDDSGELLATSSNDQTIKLWRLGDPPADGMAADGEQKGGGGGGGGGGDGEGEAAAAAATLEGHEAAVYAVAMSGGGVLASASGDESVKLWDSATATCTATLEGHEAAVACVAFSPSSPHLLLSGGWDSQLKMWDTRLAGGDGGGKAQVASLLRHRTSVSCASFFPGGSPLCVSGSGDMELRLFDTRMMTRPGADCLALLQGHASSVGCCAAAGPATLLSGSGDASMRRWDVNAAAQRSEKQYRRHGGGCGCAIM